MTRCRRGFAMEPEAILANELARIYWEKLRRKISDGKVQFCCEKLPVEFRNLASGAEKIKLHVANKNKRPWPALLLVYDALCLLTVLE